MSERSFVGAAVRSVLPEQMLVEKHEMHALMLKYAFQRRAVDLQDVALSVFTAEGWGLSGKESEEFSPCKRLGNVFVDAETPVGATGYDSENMVAIGTAVRKNYVQLHIGEVDGIHDVLGGLSRSADYMKLHEQLRTQTYVVGITYEELGKAAKRVGFTEMDSLSVCRKVSGIVGAAHDAFVAVNHRDPHPVKPSMVYMPTNDFLDRFSGQ